MEAEIPTNNSEPLNSDQSTLQNTNFQPVAAENTVVPSQQIIDAAPKKKTPVWIFVVIILLVIFSGVAYYIAVNGLNMAGMTAQNTTNSTQDTAVTDESSPSVQKPLFTGKLKRLDQNFYLFKMSGVETTDPNNDENTSYFEAGVFTSGELAGYTRVIALQNPDAPTGPLVYFLATKDYKTFILDDPDKDTNSPEDDWTNPYSHLDKTKISGIATFPSELPQVLSLDAHFSLYKKEAVTKYAPTGKKDTFGNEISTSVLETDFSAYEKLTGPFQNLTIYTQPYTSPYSPEAKISAEERSFQDQLQKYIKANAFVSVLDSTGVPYVYGLTTPTNIQVNKKEHAEYDQARKDIDAQIAANNGHDEGIKYPEYVGAPTMGFKSAALENAVKTPLYKKYSLAFPGQCASSEDSRVVNVQDSELEQIGTLAGQSVFRLKDINSPLNKIQYTLKVESSSSEEGAFEEINPGMKVPTFEEYVAQNPLLFVKDYWGRWIVVGEYDLQLIGGCGKPVVYLYPEKPTEVSVKFLAPMQFTTDIPTYGDSWKVLAQPTGLLTNLKPELTNCTAIDTTHPGAEYAKDACLKNTYPYLYWAGNVASQDYPKMTEGWIVEQKNLDTFLNSKTTEMGLNATEKKDFLEYWVPELQSKNAPYYRVSFLQTQQLNALFPMAVTPQPDTTFRIFLDYDALAEKPSQNPVPQKLNKLVRHGFTLVEWGGLKK